VCDMAETCFLGVTGDKRRLTDAAGRGIHIVSCTTLPKALGLITAVPEVECIVDGRSAPRGKRGVRMQRWPEVAVRMRGGRHGTLR